MNYPQVFHGEFWVQDYEPQKEEITFQTFGRMSGHDTGTLTYYGNEDSILEIYHVPSNFQHTHYKYNEVMWGCDANGHIFSLFNVVLIEQNIGEFTNAKFTVGLIVIGEHIFSLKDTRFSRCIVQFPYLRNWAFHNSISIQENDEGKSIKLEKNTTLNYLADSEISKNVRWRLRSLYNLHISFFNTAINQTTEFLVDAPDGLSINDYLQQIAEFSNFLSIALYRNQNPSGVQFINKENGHKSALLFKIDHSEDPKLLKLIDFNILREKVPSMIKIWHDNYKNLSPISDYLIESFRKSKYFDVPDFLIIAEALDGFFKRFVNKKDGKDIRKYADEIAKLLEIFQDIEAIQLCNIDIEVLKDSRNKYTHLYPDEEGSKAVEGEELYWLTEKCKILLTCCILNLLGLTNDEINRCFENPPISNVLESLPLEI